MVNLYECVCCTGKERYRLLIVLQMLPLDSDRCFIDYPITLLQGTYASPVPQPGL